MRSVTGTGRGDIGTKYGCNCSPRAGTVRLPATNGMIALLGSMANGDHVTTGNRPLDHGDDLLGDRFGTRRRQVRLVLAGLLAWRTHSSTIRPSKVLSSTGT